MKYVIQSKDRTQYVGKNLYDTCEDINKARKFNSKFEAEQFLDKHCKTLLCGYWKVIVVGGVEEKKNLKESTDEDFSLYDLNKHDPFVKEWVKNINKELEVSIESIGDDEIIFRVWFDESMDLDAFDDIATDWMPRTLIEFMSDMNIDFGYQFVYEDDKFTENDFVFIRFVAW